MMCECLFVPINVFIQVCDSLVVDQVHTHCLVSLVGYYT